MDYRGDPREVAHRSLRVLLRILPARLTSVLRSGLTGGSSALRPLLVAGPHRKQETRPRAPLAVRVRVMLWFLAVEARTRHERARVCPACDRGGQKVYFVIRSAYGLGGTIRSVFTTADYLVGHGYDVEVVSLLRPRAKPFLPLDPRVRVTPLFDERGRTRDIPLLPGEGSSPVPFLRPDQVRRLDGMGQRPDASGRRRVRTEQHAH